MDPAEKLFGRPVFSGTGRVGDYIQPPPDLSYLGGRPEFIPDDHDYDPGLDYEALVRSGMPMGEALRTQEMRARAHQAQAAEMVRRDSQAALKELKDVDYTSPKVANRLLSIFSKFPNARKSKEVVESVNFMRSLKPQEETLDIEGISDPILYNKAKAEKWNALPKAQAERLMGAYEHNRKVLSQAVENGLTEDDLKDAMDPAAGIYDPIKVSQKIRAGRYNPAEETDPRLVHRAVTEGWDKLSKTDAARKRTAALLNLGIEDDAESMGVPAEELSQFIDKDTGVYDVGKVKGHLRQYASKLKTYPTGDIAKYTARAKEEREALLSDESKLAYLQKKHGDDKRTDFPKEEWDEAYATLNSQRTPSEEALASIQAAMGGKPKDKVDPQSTEKKSEPKANGAGIQVLNDNTVVINGKTYTGSKEQIASLKQKAGL